MATQLKSDELNGCKSYFEWLCEWVIPEGHRYVIVNRETGKKIFTKLLLENIEKEKLGNKGANKNLGHECAVEKFGQSSADIPSGEESETEEDIGKVKLCRFLYGVDFTVDPSLGCVEDETQGVNGMELRRRYAESIGKESGKSERDIDRIWKTIHGKCSVLELLVNLCIRLDEMTNEEESGTTVYKFFDVILENLAIDITDSEAGWSEVIGDFLHRNYNKDGSGGGLFPVKNIGDKDARKMLIWSQLNAWLNEHLNEDAEFEW